MRYDLRDHELLVETLQVLQRSFSTSTFSYYKDVLDEELGILSFEAPRYLYDIGREMVHGLAIFENIDDFERFPTKEALIVQLEQGFTLASKCLQEIPIRVPEHTIQKLPPDIADWTHRLYAQVHKLLTACLIMDDMAADLRGAGQQPEMSSTTAIGVDKRTVFVVHGRNEPIRRGLFEFLRALGLRPLEWTEAMALTGTASPYIGEILEHAFSAAQAVVVLLTPDDEVRLRPDLCLRTDPSLERELSFQARPNVLFEAGMAFGRHPHRTVLIEIGDVKPFSDIAGRHVVRLDDTPAKRLDVAKRLQTAGCEVNTSGQDWLSAGSMASP